MTEFVGLIMSFAFGFIFGTVLGQLLTHLGVI